MPRSHSTVQTYQSEYQPSQRAMGKATSSYVGATSTIHAEVPIGSGPPHRSHTGRVAETMSSASQQVHGAPQAQQNECLGEISPGSFRDTDSVNLRAQSQDRRAQVNANKYTLALIDGNGYSFPNKFFTSEDELGCKAMQKLRGAIVAALPAADQRNARIVLKIHADFDVLSQIFEKAKWQKTEDRRLERFVAEFNESEGADFVDAGKGVVTKTEGTLSKAVDDPHCTRIFFGGCHNIDYIGYLSSLMGMTDKITLIRADNFVSEFDDLGMPTIKFNDVLTGAPRELCKFFPVNACNPPNGQACKFSHVIDRDGFSEACPAPNGKKQAIDGLKTWRQPETEQLCIVEANHRRTPSTPSTSSTPSTPPDSPRTKEEWEQLFKTALPKWPSEPVEGIIAIPVNDRRHRLDPYIPPSDSEDQDHFNLRQKKKPLCNRHHILRACQSTGDICKYDHSSLEPRYVRCLERLARTQVCEAGGACRSLDCTKGHICQLVNCEKRLGPGHKDGVRCNIPTKAHEVSYFHAEMEPGYFQKKSPENQKNNGQVTEDEAVVRAGRSRAGITGKRGVLAEPNGKNVEPSLGKLSQRANRAALSTVQETITATTSNEKHQPLKTKSTSHPPNGTGTLPALLSPQVAESLLIDDLPLPTHELPLHTPKEACQTVNGNAPRHEPGKHSQRGSERPTMTQKEQVAFDFKQKVHRLARVRSQEIDLLSFD